MIVQSFTKITINDEYGDVDFNSEFICGIRVSLAMRNSLLNNVLVCLPFPRNLMVKLGMFNLILLAHSLIE